MRGTRASVVNSVSGATPGGMMRSNTACSSGEYGAETGSTRGSLESIYLSFPNSKDVASCASGTLGLTWYPQCQASAPRPAQEDVFVENLFSRSAWHKESSTPCAFLSLDRVGRGDGLFGAPRSQIINPVLNAPDQQDLSASFSHVENIFKESPD